MARKKSMADPPSQQSSSQKNSSSSAAAAAKNGQKASSDKMMENKGKHDRVSCNGTKGNNYGSNGINGSNGSSNGNKSSNGRNGRTKSGGSSSDSMKSYSSSSSLSRDAFSFMIAILTVALILCIFTNGRSVLYGGDEQTQQPQQQHQQQNQQQRQQHQQQERREEVEEVEVVEEPEHHESKMTSFVEIEISKEEAKTNFLKWFTANGGIFHPITADIPTKENIDTNEIKSFEWNVTLEEFPSYGGWGLALPVAQSFFETAGSDSMEECKSETETDQTGQKREEGERQCQKNPSSTQTAKLISHSLPPKVVLRRPPIIKHLDPLFTVPPSIILSVHSILDTYASPQSSLYLDSFYDRVNSILKRSFPNNNEYHDGVVIGGLDLLTSRDGTRGGTMLGLVEQDVVMALYLMVEECHHRNVHLFYSDVNISDGDNSGKNDNSGSSGNRGNHEDRDSHDSHWGPYLDVLPTYLIPRLDTFGDEEYAILNDDKLEYMGRHSKRTLVRMFHQFQNSGIENMDIFGVAVDSSIPDVSLKSVVHDMIVTKLKVALGQRRKSSDPPPSVPPVPSYCLRFESFHRFVAIISSRAMVLKGVKYLTPLAEMINYAPKVVNPVNEARVENMESVESVDSVESVERVVDTEESAGREASLLGRVVRPHFILTPFDLYHTISKDNNSITVRSDRDVFATEYSSIERGGSSGSSSGAAAMIQLFEDYGPVDSSLFLEAHGFIPMENPHHCAIIKGSYLLPDLPDLSDTDVVASSKTSEALSKSLQALKTLRLIHPHAQKLDALEDVCARKDLSIVEDGNRIDGRRPASDSIAIASLLLGNEDEVWNLVKGFLISHPDYHDNMTLESLRQMCTSSIDSGDFESIEVRCARYPGNGAVVRWALQHAARRSMQSVSPHLFSKNVEENSANDEQEQGKDSIMDSLLLQLREAESKKKDQLALALRFRIEERKIWMHIANFSNATTDAKSQVERARNVSDETNARLDLDDKIQKFHAFVQSLDLPVNKIEPKIVIGSDGTESGMRLGAFATEDLELGDVYISIPPHATIDLDTVLRNYNATSAGLNSLLQKYATMQNSKNGQNSQSDGFDVILLYLLHERFVLREKSHWWPYLDLLPTVQDMIDSHPLFAPQEEIDSHLAGSDVRRFLHQYQQRVSEKHRAISSDLEAHLVLGSEILLDSNKFYWGHAILDSRSIWWDGKRHLVPLLDLVNADGRGAVHETKLVRYDVDTATERATETVEPNERRGNKLAPTTRTLAVTHASRFVKQGGQIFENYGQPNHLLFTYHGFVLEGNPHDCALLGGLSIQRIDPGAKHVHRLRSVVPTFCIKGNEPSSDDKDKDKDKDNDKDNEARSSLQELADFLRIKHNLPPSSSEDNTSSDEHSGVVDDNVRPHLVRVLTERIARLENAWTLDVISGGGESMENEESTMPSRRRFMRQIVQNDLKHFRNALSGLL